MTKTITCISIFLISFKLLGQETSHAESPIKASGFIDTYFAYDFNKPKLKRQDFLYNHNRQNQIDLNLGLMKVSVSREKYRGNLALQAGTYAADNYAAEPVMLRSVFEANVGISLNTKNNLWLDAGIFPSHLGFESAISMDNLTLTRSLCAENSPYFLSGAKLTYSPSAKFDIQAVVCNGWQRIQRVSGNTLPGFGTQVVYRPNEKLTVNWSTFAGSEDPDSTRRMRYFNNFYALFNPTDKLKLIVGFDIGEQQRRMGATVYQTWFTPTVIAHYQLKPQWAAAIRGEYYQDPKSIIIPTVSLEGFNVGGGSLNIDYSPAEDVMLRVEGRMFYSQYQIFKSPAGYVNTNAFVVASLAVRL